MACGPFGLVRVGTQNRACGEQHHDSSAVSPCERNQTFHRTVGRCQTRTAQRRGHRLRGIPGRSSGGRRRRYGISQRRSRPQLLIDRYEPDYLIFSGIAGGLNPRLSVGDIVIGEELHYLETNTPIIAECAPWLEHFTSDATLVNDAIEVLRRLTWNQVPLTSRDA